MIERHQLLHNNEELMRQRSLLEGRREGENGVMEAIRMLKDNLPLDTIVKKTGMTLQRLTELRAML